MLAFFPLAQKRRKYTNIELVMGIILSASIIENLLYDRHCSSRPLAYIIFQSFQETYKEGIHLPDLQMRKPGLLKGRYPCSFSWNPQGPGRDLNAYRA